MTKPISDTEIAATIVPTALRWPDTNIAFQKLKAGVDALHNLLRGTDNNCRTVEDDRDLTPDGIQRRVANYGKQALAELKTLKEIRSASKWVADTVTDLEKRMIDLPAAPASVFDAMQAQEIREYVRDQQSPIDFVTKHSADPRVMSAVLNAPSFLSGLSDAEFNLIRTRARQTLHPEQDSMIKALNTALAELNTGVDATKRLLMSRCALRQDDDGEYRSIKEPQPKVRLTA